MELKSVNKIETIFEEQLLTYLKLSNIKLGLLINFNERLLKDGKKNCKEFITFDFAFLAALR